MRLKASFTHYLLITSAVIVLLVLEINVSFFRQGLIATPFLLLVSIAALLGDYAFDIFVVFITNLALVYALYHLGFYHGARTVIMISEYLFTTIIICVLAWRAKKLLIKNKDLSEGINKLSTIINDLEKKSVYNKRSLKKLNTLNKQLELLVNQFLEDDGYWDKRVSDDLLKKDNFKKYLQH